MQGVVQKVVLVTGAAHRLGAAIARLLHARGLAVVIHYSRSRAEAQALRDALEGERAQSAAVVAADLLDPAAPAYLVAQAIAAFGRLDYVINNASSFYPTIMEAASLADWDDLIGTNLRAPFFLAQAACAELRARQGAIINIIDIHSERPLKGYPIYSVAKAGLAMMTRALAREFAPHVRVNGVSPGTILWPDRELADPLKAEIVARIPQKRIGSPGDIASAAAYLLLDAGYVTGQILAVDGGRSVVI
ncbi:MAG: pteridine reductase [Gammaproteobacteria bacterium]|nr:pteridine reductase [Gammaproteobacteria bacterium]